MELSEKTMNDVFRNRARKYGDRLAIEKKMNGVWQSATWSEYYERACAVGLGLYSLGVQKGNMVSILSDNRLEWLYTDMMNTEVYAEQKYQHKTTFSCVAIRREGEDVFLIISHGGDSVVTVMNSVTGSICRQTGRDMNFAGRSKEIVDVTRYHMTDREARVLLSTDGFDDVWRFCLRQSLLGGARDVFERYPVEDICEMISGILEENRDRFEYDDVGFILLDPHRLERIGKTAVMMGGTRPYEEKHYHSEYASGSHDRWVSDGEWGDHKDVFAGTGIQVLGEGDAIDHHDITTN